MQGSQAFSFHSLSSLERGNTRRRHLYVLWFSGQPGNWQDSDSLTLALGGGNLAWGLP